MMRERAYKREARLKECGEIRKKNVSEYFVNFSKLHREWMQELVDKYKERGEFPVIPMAMLPSYYDSTFDKEVALFAALLIKDEGEYVENVAHVIESVQAFKEMMGESPWEWFKHRAFVKLSLGRAQDKRTGGVVNWKIAKLMDRLWGEVFEGKYGEKGRYGIYGLIDKMARVHRCSYFGVLTALVEDCGVGNYFYKLRMLLMVACSGDGFGLSLWENHNFQELCPITSGLRQFLKMWMPDYNRIGGVDEAISLFGLRGKCDFFYAWLGWKNLQKRNPKGCSLYATTYLRWYENGVNRKPCKWRLVMPEMEI